jgi:aminopeptidase YwaD
LTSDYPKLDEFVGSVARAAGMVVSTYRPTMANSDHYNFAQHGIPAMRLVCGFNRPDSDVRYILTRGDVRARVRRSDLNASTRMAAMLVWRAMTASDSEIREVARR